MRWRPGTAVVALWRQLTRGVAALRQAESADRDTADEIDHYFAEAEAELQARGLPPGEARRRLGSPLVAREQVRLSGWETRVETLWRDLRFACRNLLANPGMATLCVVTLALGIGASTAIFSAVHPILLAPLPYPQPGQLLNVASRATDGTPSMVSFGGFRELGARSKSLAATAVWKSWLPVMSAAEHPQRFPGQFVSASYFRLLGIRPRMGRDFEAADDRRHGPRVVMLSETLWRQVFGGDRGIVGKSVELDGDPYTVAGVMPSFDNVVAPTAMLWTLLQYDATLPLQGREWGQHLHMLARLRPSATRLQADRELNAIARSPRSDFPRPMPALSNGIAVTRLQDEVTRGVRPGLVAVLAAVLVLLLIACVNVTNLVFARGARRQAELALRAALGAGRGRLMRQLVTESLVLALLGGAVGVVVSQFGVRALVALSPAQLPRVSAIRIDRSVLSFALLLTTATGLGVGVLPALHATRRDGDDLPAGLRQSARLAGGPRRTRQALVVAEVALALMLLLGAGLLLRSMQRLFAVAPGFQPQHLLTLQVQTAGHRYDDDAVSHRFFAQALAAVRRVPGVTAAALTSRLPSSGESRVLDEYGLHFANDRDPRDDHAAMRCAVSPGYFETMGIPLRRGRSFVAADRGRAAARPVLINESLARRKYAGRDPIGERLRFAGPEGRPWDVIVGVVGDVRQTSLALDDTTAVYVVAEQWLWADNPLWLVVRTAGDPGALAPAVEQAVWSIDRQQPILQVASMESRLAAAAAERRFVLTLFEAFALAALLLAAVGIYGVMAGSVTERRREIGLRAALGASGSELVGLLLGEGMRLAALGVAVGLIGGWMTRRALVALLFGTSRLDLPTHLGVVVLLLGVAAAACGVPAWRAARIDPAITLQAD